MNSTTYNAQFLTIDFRLLDDPDYLKFMRSAAFPTYMMLRRYVWRGFKKRHPIDQVNDLYRQGYLVTAVSRPLLAKKLALRNVANVSRQITELVNLGLVQIFRTGRQNIFILGTWEDRSQAQDRSFLIEIFRVDQIFGAEKYDSPCLDDVTAISDVAPTVISDVAPTVISDVAPTVISDVTATVTPDVTRKSHNNKEVNRETNSKIQDFFEPVDERENRDDVIYVKF